MGGHKLAKKLFSIYETIGSVQIATEINTNSIQYCCYQIEFVIIKYNNVYLCNLVCQT